MSSFFIHHVRLRIFADLGRTYILLHQHSVWATRDASVCLVPDVVHAEWIMVVRGAHGLSIHLQ